MFPAHRWILILITQARVCAAILGLAAAIILPEPARAEDAPAEPAPPAEAPAATPAPAASLPAPPPPWTRRPYRIRIVVAFASNASLSPSFRRDVLGEMESGARRVFGPACEFEIVPAEADAPRSVESLARLSEAELAALPAEVDQRLFLVIDSSPSGDCVSGRSWTAANRRLGGIETLETLDRKGLSEATLRMVDRLFAPLLEIVDATDEQITLMLRGGDYPATDPNRPQVKPGDVLQPFLRVLDRQGEVKQVQPMTWTYLVVDKVEGPEVKARVVTGVRSPIRAKRRRGIELLAIAVHATSPATTLTLTPRGDRRRPLVAHKVLVEPYVAPSDEPPAKEAEAGKENAADKEQGKPAPPALQRLLSDRSGGIVVPRRPEAAIVWLRVFSGEQMLARVPFVPGSAPSATLELPDDTLRLSVEGELDLLKGRLVDVVARRATLISRIRTLARNGEWKAVKELQAELDELPGVKQFEQQVNAVRAPAFELARQRKDRLAEARIQQLANDSQQLIRRYLDGEKLTELREELQELKSLDAKDAGAKSE